MRPDESDTQAKWELWKQINDRVKLLEDESRRVSIFIRDAENDEKLANVRRKNARFVWGAIGGAICVPLAEKLIAFLGQLFTNHIK